MSKDRAGRRTWLAPSKVRLVAAFAAAMVGAASGRSALRAASDPLEAGFQTPPNEAKPRVWWHWMNGNVTKEGIRLDLEWMHRIGIGGFQNFDASLFGDKVVDQRLVYMTPEWKETFRYATTLADQLGLEEAIAGSPGWSESGGPWVTPAQAMKKLVWSETQVAGGRRFTGILPKPPTTTGPFQNAPFTSLLAQLSGQAPKAQPELYNDSAVIAYRVPAGDVPMTDLKPVVTWSSGTLDPSLLADGDFVKVAALPMAPVGQKAWIQFAFAKPVAIRGASLAIAGFKWPFGPPPAGPDLEASDDGQAFRRVVNIPRSTAVQNTVSFPPVEARFFRVAFVTPPPPPPMEIDLPLPSAAERAPDRRAHAAHRSAREPLRGEGGLRAAGRALGSGDAGHGACGRGAEERSPGPHVEDGQRRVARLDGAAGRWVVLRMGYSLLGVNNHPASPEGTGFEVDKLSPGAREGLHGHVPRQLPERRRPADGGARARLPHQRQL